MKRSSASFSDDESTAWSMSLQRFNVSRILSSPELSPISTDSRGSAGRRSSDFGHKQQQQQQWQRRQQQEPERAAPGGLWPGPEAGALSLSSCSLDSDVWREVESDDEQQQPLSPPSPPPRAPSPPLFLTVESESESESADEDEQQHWPRHSAWPVSRRAAWAPDDWAADVAAAQARQSGLRGPSSDHWGAAARKGAESGARTGMSARRVLSVPAGREFRRLPRPKAFIVLKQKGKGEQVSEKNDLEDDGICLRRSISAHIQRRSPSGLSSFSVKYSCDEVRRGKVEFVRDSGIRQNLRKCSSVGGIGPKKPYISPRRPPANPRRPFAYPKRPSISTRVISSQDEFLDFVKAAAEKRRRRLRKKRLMRSRIFIKAHKLWRRLRAVPKNRKVPKSRKRNWYDPGDQEARQMHRSSTFAGPTRHFPVFR